VQLHQQWSDRQIVPILQFFNHYILGQGNSQQCALGGQTEVEQRSLVG
jgi:hypothetical protein